MSTKNNILRKLDDVREFLEGIDKSLLDEFGKECLSDSEDYVGQIIDFIEDDLD